MSMQPMTAFSRALQKMRAAAILGMGEDWYQKNLVEDMDYQEIVALLRASGEDGAKVIHEFAKAFVRGMNQAADESNLDRAALVAQSKDEGDLVTGWGQAFLKVEPEDPKWFAGFEAFIPGVNIALASALEWAYGTGAGMLLLGGIPGTGKTHLAKAAYSYLTSHERDVFYRREVDLISNLQRSIQDHTVEQVMEEIQSCPWLIIDDYGAAPAGNWGRGQLDAIIDARWESATTLRTMITTNLDGEGMKKQSPRIWSRLSDRTRAKRVDTRGAEDYREKRGS